MNNDNKQVLSEVEGLVPKYRFPEFKNDGSWLLDKIGNIFTVTRGQVLSMSKVVENIDSENIYPVFSSQTKNGGLAGYYKDFLFQNAITWTTDGANAGDVNFRQGKFYCTNVCGVLLNSEGFANVFFAEILNTVTRSHVSYVGNPKLMNGVMSDIIIPFPKLKEQQKIAACLSSLDDVIAGHEEKLTALEEHKKGLMQNLFPQEGETQPKYRFPEFENDGDWVETNVGMNCKVKGRIGYRGYTTDDLVNPNEGAIVIGGKHIQNNRIELSDPTFLSWEKYYESPEIMVELNDIIFSQRGTLGDCAIIDIELGKATINPSMVLLKEISCNTKFLYYTLISDIIQNEVKKFKTLAAIPMLSQKQINGFKFYIPNPAEQQKIAATLSTVDALIVAQREKIEALKEHKNGMMQGLFPKIES